MIFSRSLIVPRDSQEFHTINKFIYLLLDKKVSRRICNFNKLRQNELYDNFKIYSKIQIVSN